MHPLVTFVLIAAVWFGVAFAVGLLVGKWLKDRG